MKRNNMIIIAVVAAVLVAGVIFYMSRTGFLQKNRLQTAATSEPAAGHQGHGTAAPQPQAGPSAGQQQEAEEAPTIEIPTDKQQMIGVKIADVAVRPLRKIIRTVGLVEYDEKKLSTVNTKFEGWIERLYVDYNGKYVKKGEPLADIYSPELVATQQEFINLLKWSKKKDIPASASQGKSTPSSGGIEGGVSGMLSRDAGVLVDAAKQRLRLWDISEAQIKKIEETGKPIRTLTIYSPVNGYVIQKMAIQGMKVMPGEKLFDLADLSSLWIVADIYESELAMVKPGERAMITLSYFPDKEFSSRIDYIYPSVSGATRTAKVRFSIPNYGGRLKPQMYTNVEIKIDLGKKLSIPDDAVIDTGTRQIVYVDKGEGNFEPREVALGMRAEGMREVVKGLKAGEKVAAAATFLIDSEAQLKNVVPLKNNGKQ